MPLGVQRAQDAGIVGPGGGEHVLRRGGASACWASTSDAARTVFSSPVSAVVTVNSTRSRAGRAAGASAKRRAVAAVSPFSRHPARATLAPCKSPRRLCGGAAGRATARSPDDRGPAADCHPWTDFGPKQNQGLACGRSHLVNLWPGLAAAAGAKPCKAGQMGLADSARRTYIACNSGFGVQTRSYRTLQAGRCARFSVCEGSHDRPDRQDRHRPPPG